MSHVSPCAHRTNGLSTKGERGACITRLLALEAYLNPESSEPKATTGPMPIAPAPPAVSNAPLFPAPASIVAEDGGMQGVEGGAAGLVAGAAAEAVPEPKPVVAPVSRCAAVLCCCMLLGDARRC